jgi:hypothetical protein
MRIFLALCTLFVAVLHSWFMNRGATSEERALVLPGDTAPPGTYFTRAISIDAPPSAVWPWLLAIGQDRAGFLSNEYLENLRREDPRPRRSTLPPTAAGPGGPGGRHAAESVRAAYRGHPPRRSPFGRRVRPQAAAGRGRRWAGHALRHPGGQSGGCAGGARQPGPPSAPVGSPAAHRGRGPGLLHRCHRGGTPPERGWWVWPSPNPARAAPGAERGRGARPAGARRASGPGSRAAAACSSAASAGAAAAPTAGPGYSAGSAGGSLAHHLRRISPTLAVRHAA